MKSVMYHYVREESSNMPYFRYLHVDNFRKQLDHFTQNYYLPSRAEFLASLSSRKCIENSMVLTFDDGVRDHFDYVLPELEKRDLWGIFYIPTGPFTTGKPLTVHLIHCLLGIYGGATVLDGLMRLVKPDMLKHSHVKEFQELTYPDQDDDLEATTLSKRILNYFIAAEWQRPIVDQLVESLPLAVNGDLYLSEAQIEKMRACGNLIGSHSVSHPLFSKLNYESQQDEIVESFAYLDSIVGAQEAKTFCYPYGGFHSFTPETESILTEIGCTFSFNVEYRDIESSDLTDRPQALPRYDCNLFPHGKAN